MVWETSLEQFLQERSLGCAVSTVANERTVLKRFLAACASDPTKADVRRFLAGHAHQSAAYRDTMLTAIRAYARWTGTDFTRGIGRPKIPRRLPPYLSPEECAALCDAANATSRSVGALVELLYATGCRISEALGLTWDDVDLDGKWARVLGKGNKWRLVPFGEPARRALLALRAEGAPTGKDYLRPARNSRRAGRPMVMETAENAIRALGKSVLNKRVHPHMFRHACATHLLEGGADLRVVQEILGHESADQTARYMLVTPMRQFEVYRRAHRYANK